MDNLIKDLAKAIKKNSPENPFMFAKLFKKYDNMTIRQVGESVKLSKKGKEV